MSLLFLLAHRLDVRVHHVLHPADIRVAKEIVHWTVSFSKVAPQRFEGDAEPDPTSELETVGDGLRRAVHLRRYSFEDMLFGSLREGRAGHARYL